MLDLFVAAALAATSFQPPAVPAPEATVDARSPAAMSDRAADILFGREEARYAEGRRLAEAAWRAGYVEAGTVLSAYLINGLGGAADPKRGRTVLHQAADRGSAAAHLTLSQAYQRGGGPFRVDAKAAYRHALAAAQATGPKTEQVRALGQWRVGMLTLEGVGTPKDARRAYSWVARSSEGGNASGMISRAVMLATGEGVATDQAAARGWYARAALVDGADHAHALRGLGGMLASGQGGPVDADRALAYLMIAKAGEDEVADRVLGKFRDTLARADRARVEAIMGDWRNDVRRFLKPDA